MCIKRFIRKDMHKNAHSNIICKHTKLETTQVLIKSKMDSSWFVSAEKYYLVVRINELQNMQQHKVHLINIIMSKRKKTH